jgi:GxxExxY protein
MIISFDGWAAWGSALDSEGRQERQEEQEAAARLERLATTVVDAGLHVHRALGPGLLEAVYEQCLSHELTLRGIAVSRQVAAPVPYKGIVLEGGYRMDLLVGDQIIIEVKSVEAHSRLHEAQLRTYLRLSSRKLGFLMNFNVVLFKDGLRRINL